MIDNRPLMGYILHCGIKKIDLNNRNLMIIRKALCISLTLLLSLGLFTTGAVAQSGCKDQACKQMLMGSSHHPGKSMSKSLLSDCCAGPHTVPCEFEPSRKTTAQHVGISSGRVENNYSAGVPFKVSGDLIHDRLPHGLTPSVLWFCSRATPIYLQNQTLIV